MPRDTHVKAALLQLGFAGAPEDAIVFGEENGLRHDGSPVARGRVKENNEP
jgi:hypothetical protein